MSALLPEYRAAIEAVRPDLIDMPMVVHTRGWDSNAVEAGDTIFKGGAVANVTFETFILKTDHPHITITSALNLLVLARNASKASSELPPRKPAAISPARTMLIEFASSSTSGNSLAPYRKSTKSSAKNRCTKKPST